MRIVWSPEALADLESMRAYVGSVNPRAAEKLALRIVSLAESQLSLFPESGRPGRVEGTRELVVSRTAYILPYRVVGREVRIIRVYHSARRWPDSFP
jgi:toxin ParE1/3/4